LPHNLYVGLRGGTPSPSLYQIIALSRISGYSLRDWLLVFGFNLEDIPRLQCLLPAKRTLLVDSALTDASGWVSWVQNRSGNVASSPVAPLALSLEPGPTLRIGALNKIKCSDFDNPKFLYAKIGAEDALAFPELTPGSIVRVNRDFPQVFGPPENRAPSARIYLVEHSKGLFCCRIRALEENTIIPVSSLLSYAAVELEHPRQAKLLGVVDLEIRPLLGVQEPEVPQELARYWTPQPLATEPNLGRLLRTLRASANLSFREVADRSVRIAELLEESRYSVSPSSLCDYEAVDGPPRDFRKTMTICSVYGLPFHRLLNAIGWVAEPARQEPIPDHFVGRLGPAGDVESGGEKDEGETAAGGFIEQLLERMEDVPFFLRHTLRSLSGLSHLSLGDFFWIGGEQNVLHPSLAGGLLALVNRRLRTPVHFAAKPFWQQPLYVILTRDGSYLCAGCGMENGTLVIHPHPQHLLRRVLFRNRRDAEVVGQIVAVVRAVA
jgi:hypothetical protein